MVLARGNPEADVSYLANFWLYGCLNTVRTTSLTVPFTFQASFLHFAHFKEHRAELHQKGVLVNIELNVQIGLQNVVKKTIANSESKVVICEDYQNAIGLKIFLSVKVVQACCVFNLF